MNPIAQGLSIPTGMLCRLRARMPFQHQCQGKQPPGGGGSAAALGLPPQLAGTKSLFDRIVPTFLQDD